MAGSVNRVTLIGRLGRDPEVRTNQDGSKIVNLTLATSETWNDKGSGEKKERTEWHRIVVFNDRTADVAERFLKKGAKIYVEGSLQTRKWTDQQGQDRYSTEVVIGRFNGQLTMLDTRSGGDSGGDGSASRSGSPARPAHGSGASSGASSGGPSWDAPGGGDLDDETPFGPEWR